MTDVTVIIIKGSPNEFKIKQKLGALAKNMCLVDYTSVSEEASVEEIFSVSKQFIDQWLEDEETKDEEEDE